MGPTGVTAKSAGGDLELLRVQEEARMMEISMVPNHNHRHLLIPQALQHQSHQKQAGNWATHRVASKTIAFSS